MGKCDFCNKEAISYGAFECYAACYDHENEGLVIENKLFDEIEKHNPDRVYNYNSDEDYQAHTEDMS